MSGTRTTKDELGRGAGWDDVAAATRALDAGATPEDVVSVTGLPQVGSFGGTAFQLAALAGSLRVIRLFVGRGADLALNCLGRGGVCDRRVCFGFTPLHEAVWHGRVEACELLLAAGADPNLLTHAGETPNDLAKVGAHRDAETAKRLRQLLRAHGGRHSAELEKSSERKR